MKKLIIKSCLVLVIGLTIWGLFIAFKPDPKTIGDLMESYEDPGMKIKIRSPFSGAVLVAKKGEIIFEKAYGEADRILKCPTLLTLNLVLVL